MNHEHFEELLVAESLGTLLAPDCEKLQAHVATCSPCQELKISLMETSTALALTAEETALPESLKRNIFAHIDQTNAASQRSTRWMTWSFALAALALMGIILPRFLNSPGVIGQLQHINGAVFIDKIAATENTPLKEGQHLTTSPGATVELQLTDRVRLKVGAESALYVKNHHNSFVLYLEQGSTFNLVKHGTAYAVITPSLKTEARGPVFFVKVNNQHQTYVCICNGHIVISHQQFQQDLQSEHHKALVATEQNGTISTEAGTMLDHTDAEGADLSTRL